MKHAISALALGQASRATVDICWVLAIQLPHSLLLQEHCDLILEDWALPLLMDS